ncbi:hypothetical protein Dsin_004428 [Dipteronia sinensis]|uniref:GDSL esterase/lipase n=1 Tax=Dipteronia sinensis TaxID=43782 RepID=A0AAE0BA01_9ROSI|nr:hypothetical protein Dsin_004428 [Dipteronia sinensis]
MASINLLIIIITFLQILIIIFFFNTAYCNSMKSPSTVLIFGDSTVDTGNNNYIETLTKANYLPYGQDFPDHIPTGRFSNGKLVPDFIASSLGIKEVAVPPFLDPNLSDDQLLSGVSFASSGSGFDDLTTLASKAIPVSKQIKLFRDYIRKIKGIAGEEKAKKIISGSLVVISAGTNDFIFCFYDIPTRRLEFSVGGYQDFLLDRLQSFVKELYEQGCRKVIIVGLPPIGCLPIQMTLKFKNPLYRKCLEDQNSDAQSYNLKLSNLIDQLQPSLPCSKIIYADIYQPLIDMINHPQEYGFVETKRGCCGSGLIEAAYLCNPATPTCGNPSQFIFWDSIHPTQSAYQFLSQCLEIEILPKLLLHQSC